MSWELDKIDQIMRENAELKRRVEELEEEIEELEEEIEDLKSENSDNDLDCENCPAKDICERPCGMGDDFEPLHD